MSNIVCLTAPLDLVGVEKYINIAFVRVHTVHDLDHKIEVGQEAYCVHCHSKDCESCDKAHSSLVPLIVLLFDLLDSLGEALRLLPCICDIRGITFTQCDAQRARMDLRCLCLEGPHTCQLLLEHG